MTFELNTAKDFWKKVSIQGVKECWLYKGALSDNGYGRFKINYKEVKAHRYALTLIQKPPFATAFALHSCHVRACCNPSHLRWGTHEDNMNDRVARKIPSEKKGKIFSKKKLKKIAREERPQLT